MRKPSKSLAKVISRTTSTTTFEISPNLGRPHQIRIHLASIGHPLVQINLEFRDGYSIALVGRQRENG